MKNLGLLWDSLPSSLNNDTYLQDLKEISSIEFFESIDDKDIQSLTDSDKNWLLNQYQSHTEFQNHRLLLLATVLRVFKERPLDIYCWIITHNFSYKTITTYGELFDMITDQPKDLILKMFAIAGLSSNSIDQISDSIEKDDRALFSDSLHKTDIDLSIHITAIKIMVILSGLLPLFEHIVECYDDNYNFSEKELNALIEKIKIFISNLTDGFVAKSINHKEQDEKSIAVQKILEMSMDLYIFDYNAKDREWLCSYLMSNGYKHMDDLIEMSDPLWLVIEAAVLSQVMPYLNEHEMRVIADINNKIPSYKDDFEEMVRESASLFDSKEDDNSSNNGESIASIKDDDRVSVEWGVTDTLRFDKLEYRQIAWLAGVLSGLTESGIRPRYNYLIKEDKEVFLHFITGKSYTATGSSQRKICWNGSSYSLKYFFVLLNKDKDEDNNIARNLPHNYSAIIADRFVVVSKGKYIDITEPTLKGISILKAQEKIKKEERTFLEQVVERARSI